MNSKKTDSPAFLAFLEILECIGEWEREKQQQLAPGVEEQAPVARQKYTTIRDSVRGFTSAGLPGDTQ